MIIPFSSLYSPAQSAAGRPRTRRWQGEEAARLCKVDQTPVSLLTAKALDVADAIMAAVRDDSTAGKIFELVG